MPRPAAISRVTRPSRGTWRSEPARTAPPSAPAPKAGDDEAEGRGPARTRVQGEDGQADASGPVKAKLKAAVRRMSERTGGSRQA